MPDNQPIDSLGNGNSQSMLNISNNAVQRKVSLKSDTNNVNTRIIRYLKTGDCFGDIACITGKKHTASIRSGMSKYSE